MSDEHRSQRPPAAGRRPAETQGSTTPKIVVFALYDKVTLQDVAAPLEIFARANDFGAQYRVILASPTGAAVATTSFVSLNVDMPLAEVPDRIDTLIVPGGVPPDFSFTPGEHDIPEEQTPDVVAAALQMVGELAPRARRVASVCTGAFVLASLGLLDGRRATTHWAHCQELARTYPEIEVVPDSLFVQDGPYITGAGISAGIDLGLAMVESDYGPDVARRVARWMVVFLQRPGGQAQFSVWTEAALPVSSGLREILDSVVADPGCRSLHRRDGGSRGGKRAASGAHVPRSGRVDPGPVRRASATGGGEGAAGDRRPRSGSGRAAGRFRVGGHHAAHLPARAGRLTQHVPESIPDDGYPSLVCCGRRFPATDRGH